MSKFRIEKTKYSALLEKNDYKIHYLSIGKEPEKDGEISIYPKFGKLLKKIGDEIITYPMEPYVVYCLDYENCCTDGGCCSIGKLVQWDGDKLIHIGNVISDTTTNEPVIDVLIAAFEEQSDSEENSNSEENNTEPNDTPEAPNDEDATEEPIEELIDNYFTNTYIIGSYINLTVKFDHHSTLIFEGGIIYKKLIGDSTDIKASQTRIFSDKCILDGTYLTSVCYPEWWGAEPYYTNIRIGTGQYPELEQQNPPEKVDTSDAIQKAFDSPFGVILFSAGNYYISKSIILRKIKNVKLVGTGLAQNNKLENYHINNYTTVIWTDQNIDVLVIKLEPYIENIKGKLLIEGGELNVERCDGDWLYHRNGRIERNFRIDNCITLTDFILTPTEYGADLNPTKYKLSISENQPALFDISQIKNEVTNTLPSLLVTTINNSANENDIRTKNITNITKSENGFTFNDETYTYGKDIDKKYTCRLTDDGDYIIIEDNENDESDESTETVYYISDSGIAYHYTEYVKPVYTSNVVNVYSTGYWNGGKFNVAISGPLDYAGWNYRYCKVLYKNSKMHQPTIDEINNYNYKGTGIRFSELPHKTGWNYLVPDYEFVQKEKDVIKDIPNMKTHLVVYGFMIHSHINDIGQGIGVKYHNEFADMTSIEYDGFMEHCFIYINSLGRLPFAGSTIAGHVLRANFNSGRKNAGGFEWPMYYGNFRESFFNPRIWDGQFNVNYFGFEDDDWLPRFGNKIMELMDFNSHLLYGMTHKTLMKYMRDPLTRMLHAVGSHDPVQLSAINAITKARGFVHFIDNDLLGIDRICRNKIVSIELLNLKNFRVLENSSLFDRKGMSIYFSNTYKDNYGLNGDSKLTITLNLSPYVTGFDDSTRFQILTIHLKGIGYTHFNHLKITNILQKPITDSTGKQVLDPVTKRPICEDDPDHKYVYFDDSYAETSKRWEDVIIPILDYSMDSEVQTVTSGLYTPKAAEDDKNRSQFPVRKLVLEFTGLQVVQPVWGYETFKIAVEGKTNRRKFDNVFNSAGGDLGGDIKRFNKSYILGTGNYDSNGDRQIYSTLLDLPNSNNACNGAMAVLNTVINNSEREIPVTKSSEGWMINEIIGDNWWINQYPIALGILTQGQIAKNTYTLWTYTGNKPEVAAPGTVTTNENVAKSWQNQDPDWNMNESYRKIMQLKIWNQVSPLDAVTPVSGNKYISGFITKEDALLLNAWNTSDAGLAKMGNWELSKLHLGEENEIKVWNWQLLSTDTI